MCFEIYKTITSKGLKMCKRFHFYLFFCKTFSIYRLMCVHEFYKKA